MDPKYIEELKKRIKNHFASITEDKLRQNLLKAGVEIYTDLDSKFLGGEEPELERRLVEPDEFIDEANSFCVRVYQAAIRILEIENRPTYPSKERNYRSANQDSNIRTVKEYPNSSSEDSFYRGVCI